ncbi:MAG: type 1 glutamine amidotransferase [Paracoccaceae bacterium]
MTNTDESDFAQRHPKDGEKFTDLVHLARPDWSCSVFAVKDGEFPDDLSAFDGVIITGSPSSVRSGAAWVDRLLALIRQMDANRKPLFGACFGHQATAVALGGALDHNPQGWVHGLTRNALVTRPDWASELPETVKLYGSHCEYVSKLPTQAQPFSQSNNQTSGFTVGQHIFTTQHHPEMSPGFIAALTDEMKDTLGPDDYFEAHASLKDRSDQLAFAETIARFFEAAAR